MNTKLAPVALFIFILIAHQLGWIQSTGVPVGPAR